MMPTLPSVDCSPTDNGLQPAAKSIRIPQLIIFLQNNDPHLLSQILSGIGVNTKGILTKITDYLRMTVPHQSVTIFATAKRFEESGNQSRLLIGNLLPGGSFRD